MRVSTILDQIDLGAVALPELQRGYVSNQVRGLVESLYRSCRESGRRAWCKAVAEPQRRSPRGYSEGRPPLL